MKLRIGEIPYANLFPIFYTLKNEFDCSAYEFAEGAPSQVNKMLRSGEVDLSPSSSVEYLRNPSLYRVIEGHSISSQGTVGSILLFTDKPIEKLEKDIIYVSSQSETSVALLDIILKRFYGISCELRVSHNPEKLNIDSFLLIGDDALKYICGHYGRIKKSFTYDLGDVWHKRTGLPFVFALWIVRSELYADKEKHALLDRFILDLEKAKNIALKNLGGIAKHAPMKSFMSEEEILAYWNRLDYDFGTEHKKGLELFRQFLMDSPAA